MGKQKNVSAPESRREAAEALVDRLTPEGLDDLAGPLRDGGLGSISIWKGMRLCLSGKLEAIKVEGRWMTSVAAVRRYLAARALETVARTSQRKSPVGAGKAASAHYLDSIGLGREGSEE